jgi:histidyl-tRNA synthetase
MKSIIQGVKGAREFYPAQMEIRNFLYEHIKKVSTLFGYEEYDGPFLEKIDLYAAKSGEELVKEQAFVFPDRGGELITLRPELTPSLARMVAEKQNELVYPLRWWSFGPFWRYEKPQKGRTREFFQWNIDLIGLDSAYADAELICICATFLKEIGLLPSQVQIFINHRQLMDKELLGLGINPEQKKRVFKLIDRIDKLPPSVWDQLVLDQGVNSQQLEGLKKIVESKDLWKESEYLVSVFKIIETMGLKDYVRFNPRIIRGLDYYTGLVFEAWDADGDGRAVLGGGHYDNLVGDVGGNPLPGIGFAMGDVMIELLLQKYGCLQNVSESKIDVLVTTFDESTIGHSFELLKTLHENDIPSVIYPQASKLQKQLKYADRMGIKNVIICGPSEMETETITIKSLDRSTQMTVNKTQMVDTIKTLIARS